MVCKGTIYIVSGKKWCVGEKKSSKWKYAKVNKSKKSKKSKKSNKSNKSKK